MPLAGLAALHADLGYTEADMEVLRSIRQLWARLERLKKGTDLGPYRELLAVSLVQARRNRVTDDFIAQCATFWAWYDSEYARLGIAEREVQRCEHHYDWCAKHVPKEHMFFTSTLERVIEMPTQLRIDELRLAAGALLGAYIGFLQGP